MQSCASPGLFFEVWPTQGISEAMNTLFQKAVADARISRASSLDAADGVRRPGDGLTTGSRR